MTLLYLYSQDSYKPVIKHYIKCLVDEDFFPSNIILISDDNYLKKQILRQLSKLTQIDILNVNKPFTTFCQSK